MEKNVLGELMVYVISIQEPVNVIVDMLLMLQALVKEYAILHAKVTALV